MRVFSMLCKSWGKKPQNPNFVPLAKPRLNFALRSFVCTKKQKSKTAPALHEMQSLISKLSQNEHSQQFCTKEVEAMRDANTASYKAYLEEKEENRTGVIRPGNKLNPIPLNKYLQKFPIRQHNPFEEPIVELPFRKQKY